jgi:hypothetical protein
VYLTVQFCKLGLFDESKQHARHVMYCTEYASRTQDIHCRFSRSVSQIGSRQAFQRLQIRALLCRMKFGPNFDWVRGGKLPGLCGAECQTGCKEVTGLDGFSSRHMWRPCVWPPEHEDNQINCSGSCSPFLIYVAFPQSKSHSLPKPCTSALVRSMGVVQLGISEALAGDKINKTS